MTSLLWDQHLCLPLQTDTDVDPLARYQRPGGAFVSVNAGYSPHSFNDTLALLRHYRAAVEAHPGLDVAAGIDDVAAITGADRIAVVFDLEDSGPLDDDSTTWLRWPTSAYAPCCRPTTTPTVPAAAV